MPPRYLCLNCMNCLIIKNKPSEINSQPKSFIENKFLKVYSSFYFLILIYFSLQIFFHVERLPEPLIGDEYYCEFKYDHSATVDFTAATRGENASFTCDTPTASREFEWKQML